MPTGPSGRRVLPARPGGFLASPSRNLVGGLLYMLVVMGLATAGYVATGWSLGDALYMVVITVFTVGYDEVRPIDTDLLRTVTIATILFGCTGIIFLTGALVQFITVNQLNQILGLRRMSNQIEKLSGHVIICGFGRIGLALAQQLQAGRVAFVVVEREEARAAQARGLGCLCIEADAAEEASLQMAGVERAHTLATVLPSDAANVFITLSARSLNPTLEIIARGDVASTESKLLQAGANRVILPTYIGAERIAEMILHREMARLIRGSERMQDFERALRALGLNMDVVTAAAGSPAVGLTVEALERAASGAFFVVQIDRPGSDGISQAEPHGVIEAGDGLVLIGRSLGSHTLFEAAPRRA